MDLTSAAHAPTPAPEPGPLRLIELTWTQVAGHIEHDPRLLVPVGTCEQHGPHLPLGADALVAERIAAELSAEFGVLIAPTITYGVNIEAARDYPGAASLARKTLHRVLNDLLASWEEQGFQEFILITAHSYDPHLDALATVVTEHARVRVIDVYSVDISRFLERQAGPQHACEAETSILLHLRGDLVRADRFRDCPLDPKRLRRYLRGRMPDIPSDCEGTIGYPSAASAEKGERIYRHIMEKIRTKVFLAPES